MSIGIVYNMNCLISIAVIIVYIHMDTIFVVILPNHQCGFPLILFQVELHFKQEANNASQSLNRLKKKYTSTKSHNDAKEWFRMQNRWIENIETDPNYFDDCL